MRTMFFAAAIFSSGCYRMMSVFNDTGTASQSDPSATEAVSKRSYENPDVDVDANERNDIEAMCSAIVAHDKANTPRDKDRGAYGDLSPQSPWGIELHKHLNSEGRHVVGPRLARLLKHEGMKWTSSDCRAVIKRYSSYH